VLRRFVETIVLIELFGAIVKRVDKQR